MIDTDQTLEEFRAQRLNLTVDQLRADGRQGDHEAGRLHFDGSCEACRLLLEGATPTLSVREV